MKKSALPETQRGGQPLTAVDFSLTPFIAFWEVTRACALACRHCRATAQPRRHHTAPPFYVKKDRIVSLAAPTQNTSPVTS